MKAFENIGTSKTLFSIFVTKTSVLFPVKEWHKAPIFGKILELKLGMNVSMNEKKGAKIVNKKNSINGKTIKNKDIVLYSFPRYKSKKPIMGKVYIKGVNNKQKT